MNRRMVAQMVSAALLLSAGVLASDGGVPDAGSRLAYVWGKPLPEQIEVLALTGDVTRGKEAFVVCRGCHKPDAAGVADGTYPRLTGQHARVIIKQVTEVRAGVRHNPKMEPFSSSHAVSPQEIADLAVFLAAAETTRESGQGPGRALERGKALYEANGCLRCHGARGEGNADKFFPAVAAQHFGYLERELRFIQQGTRGNSHPEMVEAVRRLTREDLEALADYLSRLPDPRRAAAAGKSR